MVAQILTPDPQTLHSLQSVESHIERLFQEIEALINKKKEVESVAKYTAEIKAKISKIQGQIDHKQQTIAHCQKMLGFPPGSLVRNGTTKPGTVIDLVISGQVPEVHVRWHGATVAVPESPARLTLVSPEMVKYVWYGDRYPKLVRRIDGWECDEIAILDQHLAKAIADLDDSDRRFKIAYCKKRIALIDQEDLVNLERAVRQGLAVFYRVGEALAEIRDRALYKLHGYTDFREYLREEWNMGKSQAYRLIDSSEVISNLKSVPNWGQKNDSPESVPNWGQKAATVLPNSEAVTRELAKLPLEQQSIAWHKAVATAPDNKPTAAHTKAVVAELVNSRDNQIALQINNFKKGQLVQIKSDRSDKRLVGYNLSVGVVTAVNPATVNLKIWGEKFNNVSPSDLLILDEQKLPVVCLAPNAEQYRFLLNNFQCKEEILEAALKP
jgi:hypothetical protein